jgi:predicted phage terminase large subunit-like protein
MYIPSTLNLEKCENPFFKNRLCIDDHIKFAKFIAPSIFEKPTPLFHIDLLNFVNGIEKFKAAAVFRNAGKTTLLNKVTIAGRLFFEHEPFIMIVSDTNKKAANFLADIKTMILSMSEKGLAIERGDKWANDEIDVVVNRGKSNEAICRVVSIGAGQSPRGYTNNNVRPTLIIADDLESPTGQYAIANKKNRVKLTSWFYGSLLPCLHTERGQILIIGTILHEDSLLNNIITHNVSDTINIFDEEEEQDKKCETYSDEWDIRIYPILKDGKSIWESRFPTDTVIRTKKKLERKGLGNSFYQEYMCKAISPDKQLFKKEQFNYFEQVEYEDVVPSIHMRNAIDSIAFKAPAAKAIRLKNAEVIPLSECEVCTTMDLASYDGSDRTAIMTFAVHKKDNRIFVLDITAGHFTPFEKSIHAIRIQVSFNPSRFGIEKASAQNDFFYTIAEAQKQTGVKINVTPLSHHSRQKNIRIANLHPLFVSRKVYFNESQAMTAELEAELLGFDPEVESKHDDIMDAMAYLLEFIGHNDIDVFDDNNEWESAGDDDFF